MNRKRATPRRAASDRVAVVVMGPPRSGTSAVSHLLSELGVYFGDPERFVDPSENDHNPIFFELRSVNDLNERLFEARGIQYSRFDVFPPEMPFGEPLRAEEVLECRGVIDREFGVERSVIGLKDPRFCFTAPIWRAALESDGYEVRFIITMRDARAVAKSNDAVNGRGVHKNRRIATLSALYASVVCENAPCTGVEYEHLIEAPTRVATQLAKWLGFDARLAESAASVIKPSLQHFPSASPSEDRRSAAEVMGQSRDEFLRLSKALTDPFVLAFRDESRKELREANDVVNWLQGRLKTLEQDYLPDARIRSVASIAAATVMTEARASIDQALAIAADGLRRASGEATALEELRLGNARRISDLESAIFDRDRAFAKQLKDTEDRARAAIDELEARCSSHEDESRRARGERDSLLAANDLLAGEVKGLARRLGELEEALVQRDSAIRQAVNELSSERALHDQCRLQCAQVEGALESAELRAAGAERDATDSHRQAVALVEKLELRDRERDELHARLKECVDESARLETALAEARETSRRATADLRQLDLALRSKWTLAKMLFGGGRAAP